MSPLDRNQDEVFVYKRRLNRLLLCLDDLEDVLEHLHLHVKNVVLLAGEGVAENGPDDLLSATREEMREVRIISFDPQIHIRLMTVGSVIGTTSRGQSPRKLVDELYSLLEARRRLVVAPTHLALIIISLLLTSIFYIPMVANIRNPEFLYYEIILSVKYFVIAFVVSFIMLVQYNFRGAAIIVRKWRRDRFLLINDLFKETWKVVITLIITAALPAFYVAYKFATSQWSSIGGAK